MANTLHARLLALAQRDGWNVGGWKSGIEKRLRMKPWWGDEAEDFLYALRGTSCIPDAWRVCVEGPRQGWGYPVLVMEVLEVEVSHQLSKAKISAYARLAADADCFYDLEFRLFRLDRFGFLLLVLGGQGDQPQPRLIASEAEVVSACSDIPLDRVVGKAEGEAG
jgi:hypothetical protein